MAKISVNTFSNYVIYVFLIFEIIGTAWICGHDDHNLLKLWYVFTMFTLFCTRICSFYRKDYMLYLLEMCYVVNIVSMFSVYFNVGIEYVYPFLHGPLIAYSLFYGDALIVHDLDKTTSLAIHAFGAVITRRLYWQGDIITIRSLNLLSIESFSKDMLTSFVCYLFWAIPYVLLYLLPYNGNKQTMIKYVAKLKNNDIVTFQMKMQYIFWHMIYVMGALIIGNLTMYCWQLDYLLIFTQVLSGIIHGGWYYYKEHKFKFNEAKSEIIKIIENNVEIKDINTILLKLKEEDESVEHLQIKFGSVPKVITINKSKND